MEIRSSVCALIRDNNRVLTIKKQSDEDFFYILPGGGQEFGETLIEALQREVREEVGASIRNNLLLCVREYIGKNHEHFRRDKNIHIASHIFLCEIDEEDKYIQKPDEDQVGCEWISIDELENYNFYPRGLIEIIKAKNGTNLCETYIGDIN